MNNTTERFESIDKIFTTLELQGVDTNSPLLYGYFFIDKSKEKLENIKEILLAKGYIPISLESNNSIYMLHIEKDEIHSRQSLQERLVEFDELAHNYEIELFDGWDVGNVNNSEALVSNKVFEDFLESKPISELYNLAVDLLNNQIFEKAILAFDKCIAHNIEPENSLYKQFICYDYLEQSENAISKLKDVLKLNPKHFKACFNIGALAYDLEDYQTSIEYYTKAAEIDNESDSVFYGIAASQYCIGELDESEKNCKLALKLNPENENAKILLNMINE